VGFSAGIFIFCAYILGGISAGYYLVHFKIGTDIREYGSGSVGARNVKRLLGSFGFYFTLFFDGFKGLVAVLVAQRLGFSQPVVSLVFVAVIAGHIWPIQLRFRGGKGIATSCGALLAYSPLLLGGLLGLTLLFLLLRMGFIFAGITAFLFLPLVGYFLDMPPHQVGAMGMVSAFIVFAHRERVQKIFVKIRENREM